MNDNTQVIVVTDPMTLAFWQFLQAHPWAMYCYYGFIGAFFLLVLFKILSIWSSMR